MSFIVENQVLSDVEHGFRTNKSCETALQCFVKSMQEGIEGKMNPTGIFLHLRKAYDILNHTTLMSKLNSYGIKGVVNLWFQSHVK
jgi:hypothetical protein